MRGIGLDGLQLRTALVVEFLDQSGVADKGLGRGDILDPVPFPQTIRPAKGGDAAFGADAGAGEDDDIVDSLQHPPPITVRFERSREACGANLREI